MRELLLNETLVPLSGSKSYYNRKNQILNFLVSVPGSDQPVSEGIRRLLELPVFSVTGSRDKEKKMQQNNCDSKNVMVCLWEQKPHLLVWLHCFFLLFDFYLILMVRFVLQIYQKVHEIIFKKACFGKQCPKGGLLVTNLVSNSTV